VLRKSHRFVFVFSAATPTILVDTFRVFLSLPGQIPLLITVDEGHDHFLPYIFLELFTTFQISHSHISEASQSEPQQKRQEMCIVWNPDGILEISGD
jgi:hypothetical protein